MRIIAALALVMVVLLSGASPAASAADYPTLEYYVTDQAGVLLTSELDDIEWVCMHTYAETGAEMAVLIVSTTQPDGITLFAVKTFEKNALGQEGKDNGLLLVLSIDESAWRIEVGYGLQGVLTNSRVGMLATDILVPYLNQSYYYEGTYETIFTLGQIIVEEYVGEPAEEKSPYPISWIPLTLWQLILVASVMVFLTIVTRGRVFLWIPFLFTGGRGGKKWGGGRSGGGGAKGKW